MFCFIKINLLTKNSIYMNVDILFGSKQCSSTAGANWNMLTLTPCIFQIVYGSFPSICGPPPGPKWCNGPQNVTLAKGRITSTPLNHIQTHGRPYSHMDVKDTCKLRPKSNSVSMSWSLKRCHRSNRGKRAAWCSWSPSRQLKTECFIWLSNALGSV